MVVAAGITALQVAANAYVSVLGKPETASSRLNLAQAFNSFGTTVGPYLGGLFILSAATHSAEEIKAMPASALQAFRIAEASSVKMPYAVIGIALVAFAALIGMFKLPPIPGLLQAFRTEHELRVTFVHYNDETERALRALAPESMEMLPLGLEDAFISYLGERGEKTFILSETEVSS